MRFLKQMLCDHSDITTTTKTNIESPMLIISTLIQCSICKKTFPQHPNAHCCYIAHIHNEIIQQQLIEQWKRGQFLFQQQPPLRTQNGI